MRPRRERKWPLVFPIEEQRNKFKFDRLAFDSESENCVKTAHRETFFNKAHDFEEYKFECTRHCALNQASKPFSSIAGAKAVGRKLWELALTLEHLRVRRKFFVHFCVK